MLANLFLIKRLLSKKITKKIALAGFLAVFLLIFLPAVAWAQDSFGLEDAAGIGLGGTDLKTIIARIIQIILGFLGIMAVAIIIYGGYVWMTAAGDPAKVEKAKKILINAIIGLIIILSAFTIVSFILRVFLGGGEGGPRRPGGPNDWGRWGIGRGPIEAVYPGPNQREVPINTWIAVTFKETVQPNTICKDNTADGGNNNGICDNNEKINNVEICKLDANYICETSGGFAIVDFTNTTVTQTTDNKTFVFTPNKYLGLEDKQNRLFQVLLKSGIQRAADNKPILETLFNQQFFWSFTTNGELDLDPPEIVSTNAILNPQGAPAVSGVYPDPDNSADLYQQISPATFTQFNLTASNNNFHAKVNSSFTQPQASGGSPAATLSGSYGGSASGNVTVTIASNGSTVTVDWPGAMANYSSAYNGGQIIDIGPYGLIFTLSAQAAPGNSWVFMVTAFSEGDKIQILDSETVIKTYYFGAGGDIAVGADATVTVNNIVNKIINDNSAIFASCGSNCIKTIVSGELSRRFGLNFIDSDAITTLTIAKIDGNNASQTRTDQGQPDVARNTIFQINFNEAINPVYLDKVIVKYDKNLNNIFADDDETITNAKIEISNQYRTIELLGPTECGTNSCGNPIFCWPVNQELDANGDGIIDDPNDYVHKATHYQVAISAADLMASDDARCSQWGGADEGTSGDRCFKTINGTSVFYPAANSSINGIIDMAANSFNGSFNYYQENNKIYGIANGPKSDYNLNATEPNYYQPSDPEATGGFGDSFRWSFWLSDFIDREAPLINKLGPAGMRGDESSRQLNQPVAITFDRLMRSATLKPGWNYGEQGDKKARSIRYLALETLTANANPVGFWISKFNGDKDRDNLPDYTLSEVNHNFFDYFIQYGPLAGSGLESITQNCFLPGGGPRDAGSGECFYSLIGSTSGCIRDIDLGSRQVKLPNPASYGKLNCEQITDAQVCGASQDCKILYYDADKPETDLAGSWVIAKDKPTADAIGRTGCCFGKCVARYFLIL